MTGPSRRPLAAVFGVALGIASVSAQMPLRQHDVEVPGLGIRLSAGWRLLLRDGCRLAVPAAWDASSGSGEVFGPDGSMVWVSAAHPRSWSSFKMERKAALGTPLIRDDNDRRLWLQVPDGHRVIHFVDVDAGVLVCSCVLDMRRSVAGAEEIAMKIIESVGAAPASWPEELK